MIEVKLFPGKGRGIVATQAIKKGTIIEEAPVHSFSAEEKKLIDETTVSVYNFVKPSEYSDSKDQVSAHIVFGLSSLCNHAENPNSKIDWIENDIGSWAKLTAIEDIQAEEEVTLFYTDIDAYSFT